MASGVNFDDFELRLVAPDFFKKHFRVNVKLYDPDGYFGMKGYDYLVFGEKELIRKNGAVCLKILLHTSKSVENMRDEKFDQLTDFLDTKGIDIDQIIDGEILVAAGPNNRSSIGYNSLSIFFRNHKTGEKNEQNSKLVRAQPGCRSEPQEEEASGAQKSEGVPGG